MKPYDKMNKKEIIDMMRDIELLKQYATRVYWELEQELKKRESGRKRIRKR